MVYPLPCPSSKVPVSSSGSGFGQFESIQETDPCFGKKTNSRNLDPKFRPTAWAPHSGRFRPPSSRHCVPNSGGDVGANGGSRPCGHLSNRILLRGPCGAVAREPNLPEITELDMLPKCLQLYVLQISACLRGLAPGSCQAKKTKETQENQQKH